MKKKKIFKYAGFCLTLLLLVIPEVNAGWEDMVIIKYNFDVSTGPRHEGNAEVVYNPIEGEFILMWNTSGPLRDDCDPGDEYECDGNFHNFEGRRISPGGDLMGDPIQLNPPDESDKHGPKLAYNIFTNEYMAAMPFLTPPAPWELYMAKLNNLGDIQSGPQLLYGGMGGEVMLPDIVFNPLRREYLVVYNDRDIFNANLNNVGFILDENGNTLHGPFPVGNQVGDFFAQRAAYNPMNDTYLVVWEDFRHVDDWMYDNGDVYGALLDAEDGSMIVEIAVRDDFGTPDDADQRVPVPRYNPDKNEFLIAWRDHRAGVNTGGALFGRFFNPDGTPKGPDFSIIDGPSMEGTIEAYYVQEEQKYFITWTDNRASAFPNQFYFLSDNPDIYGQWLDDTATPIGEEIPLCTEPGVQYHPHMDYDPVTRRFLISWEDWNAPGDYAVGPAGDISSELPGDKRATLYGIPPDVTLNVGNQWANCGDVGVKIPICLSNLKDEIGAVQVELCESKSSPETCDLADRSGECTITRNACESDANCPPGECSESGEGCYSTVECPTSLCANTGSSCAVDADCPPFGDQTCNLVVQTCDPVVQTCDDLSECSNTGWDCTSDAECNNKCSITGEPCAVDGDCPITGAETCLAGQTCDEIYTCEVSRVKCATDGDCHASIIDDSDCLICVGCEMTERTTIFDCMVNELDNGCCAVVIFSKNPGGVINPGECDIVVIDYTLKDEPPCCTSCIKLVPENIEVVTQYGYLVETMVGDTGMVCPFECGDVEPAASTATIWDCGDGDVDIFDILEEVDFIIHVKDPDDCQAVRADVPTGTPPNCEPPDGTIDVGDLMVIIDMALNRQDCCSYYYGGVIY